MGKFRIQWIYQPNGLTVPTDEMGQSEWTARSLLDRMHSGCQPRMKHIVVWKIHIPRPQLSSVRLSTDGLKCS